MMAQALAVRFDERAYQCEQADAKWRELRAKVDSNLVVLDTLLEIADTLCEAFEEKHDVQGIARTRTNTAA